MRVRGWTAVQWNIPGAISFTRTRSVPARLKMACARLRPDAPAGETPDAAPVRGRARARALRAGGARRPAPAGVDVDPGLHPRVRRHRPPRGRPAAGQSVAGGQAARDRGGPA